MSPGQCFPLNGSNGYVDIHLHTPIAITGFSLEHIPSAIAYDITSAPNKVTLEVLSAPQTHKVRGGLFTSHKTHGPFRYNLKANSAVQTFSIFSESPEPVSFVRFKVRAWQVKTICNTGNVTLAVLVVCGARVFMEICLRSSCHAVTHDVPVAGCCMLQLLPQAERFCVLAGSLQPWSQLVHLLVSHSCSRRACVAWPPH